LYQHDEFLLTNRSQLVLNYHSNQQELEMNHWIEFLENEIYYFLVLNHDE
jgi:hypothetical protein